MIRQKSYTLYNNFNHFPRKFFFIKNNQNSDTGSIIKPNSITNNIIINNFPEIKTNFNNNTMKRTKSTKYSVDYKFYKLLRRSSLTPNRKRVFLYDNSIDKSPFNFCLKDKEDEIIKRLKIINKGNKKHQILCDIANKKEIEKRKKAKEFFKEMKLTKINFKLMKKRDIEEQKKINILNNLKQKRKKKIKKFKNISFEHPKTTKNISNSNKFSIISFSSLIDNERKLVIKKDKLMHRFHEIMNKLKSKK